MGKKKKQPTNERHNFIYGGGVPLRARAHKICTPEMTKSTNRFLIEHFSVDFGVVCSHWNGQSHILNGAIEAVVDFYWLVVFVEQLVTLFDFFLFLN